MIGRLQGTIISKQPPLLVIDVSGVGYEVLAPMSTFYNLPDLEQPVTLLTHLVVREDAQLLYGFSQLQERSLFRTLIKVSGVGPKLALTVLSGIEPDQFVRCVQANDASSLVNIPGIGKKTAERLMVETRDSLADWPLADKAGSDSQGQHHHSRSPTQDAISALAALGYKPNDARAAVKHVSDQSEHVETLIKLALQQLAKGAK